MMNQDSGRDRLLDLLVDQALFGLAADEHVELQELQSRFPEVSPVCMDKVATLVELSALPEATEAMPVGLQERIRNGMPAFVGPADDVAVPRGHVASERELEVSSRSNLDSSANTWRQVLGWAGWALAACLLVALLLPGGGNSRGGGANLVQLRKDLLRASDEYILRDWKATEDPAAIDASGEKASGDVLWDNERQEGYLRIRGLQANNPAINQYQLWIFDDDQAHPVDGGVFDIPAGEEEVVIPIQAKIHVSKPTVFAITVEKPGGVVVSEQERVPLLAAPSGD